MSTTFPRARKLGYDIDQVEDFLEDARRAYHAQPGEPTVVTAESIRQQAFTMRKRGYAPLPGVVAEFDWKDIDMPSSTVKPLQFWMKEL